jgi:hypothetical protein
MTEEELRETEYRGFEARLANQRHQLEDARFDLRAREKVVKYWLDEINTTKRKMRPYEERKASHPQV